jgi:hypothetical protein
VMKAAAVQTIQAAACTQVPGMPGRPAERAIPVKAPIKTEMTYIAAEDAMEFQVPLAKARRELYRTGQESDDTAERMGDENMAVGDDLQTVGVVHGVIGDEKGF